MALFQFALKGLCSDWQVVKEKKKSTICPLIFYLWCSVVQKATPSLTVIINESMSAQDITWISCICGLKMSESVEPENDQIEWVCR